MKTSIFNPGVVGLTIGKFYKQPNDKWLIIMCRQFQQYIWQFLPEMLEQFALLFPTWNANSFRHGRVQRVT